MSHFALITVLTLCPMIMSNFGEIDLKPLTGYIDPCHPISMNIISHSNEILIISPKLTLYDSV